VVTVLGEVPTALTGQRLKVWCDSRAVVVPPERNIMTDNLGISAVAPMICVSDIIDTRP
jgi:hypothetical protein